jgi:hypothetical protein
MHWDFATTIMLFAAGVFLAVMFALTASSMFPREHRPRALDHPLGSALLYLSIAIVAALLVSTFWFGIQALRWYFIVIVTGVIVLFAPGLHDVLPERLREGVMGLVLGIVLNIVFHGVVWSLAYA